MIEDIVKYIESAYLMYFTVKEDYTDGESGIICIPTNENRCYFSVSVRIHEKIRVNVEIKPEDYAAGMLHEMSIATQEKQDAFWQYISILENEGAKILFEVNHQQISQDKWPENWETLYCRITKAPISNNSDEIDTFHVIIKWLMHGINLMFSLLTLSYDDIEQQNQFQDGYEEGQAFQTLSTRYERNPLNRELCIAAKGYHCNICGFDFLKYYGEIGRRYIQVHHIVPVSQIGPKYKIDPIKDLIPVCANCHAMLHRKNPPYLPEELKAIIFSQNDKNIRK